LVWDIADMLRLQEELIQVWEATAAMEATRAEVVRAVAASAQGSARHGRETQPRSREARVTLAEREAWDRVLKTEMESTASLAFVCGEVDEFARKVALLEGELADMHQAWDMADANFKGLSDRVADVNRRWQDVERQC
jgi:hypothetical protein